LDIIPGNIGAVSDERGEMFYQYISLIEKRCSGEWISTDFIG